MYQKVSTDLNFVNREKEVEQFWRDHDIFRKSMESRRIRAVPPMEATAATSNWARAVRNVVAKAFAADCAAVKNVS